MSTSYGAVAGDDTNGNGKDLSDDNAATAQTVSKRMLVIVVLSLAVVTTGVVYVHSLWGEEPSATATTTTTSPTLPLRNRLEMPDGVNFGSWLSLEDYFFASHSAIEVATPDDRTAAHCLPPLHTGGSGTPTWHAETDLLQSLTEQTSLRSALRVFHAHRTSFIDFEDDLATLAELGIMSVRVPLSWCLTDSDPAEIESGGDDDNGDALLREQFTCEDPFYQGVLWPASKY